MSELLQDTTPRLGELDETARAVLFTDARTANAFTDEPVSDDELSSIWELAKWAPTAANSQPLRVLYVRQGENRDRLVEHLSEGNQAKTAAAPAVAVLATDSRFHDRFPEVFPFRPELKDVFEENEAMRQQSGAFNSTLQAGYFILAVRAHGLAAGPMAGFDAAAVDAEFFPDGKLHAILVVNIGHPSPDAWFDRLPRLAHEDVVGWA